MSDPTQQPPTPEQPVGGATPPGPPPPPFEASAAPGPPPPAYVEPQAGQTPTPPPQPQGDPVGSPEAAAGTAAAAAAAGIVLAPEAPEPQIIQTDVDSKDGLAKCEACGSTDIALNTSTGNLRCNFCRHEWLPTLAGDAFGINGDIGLLKGTVLGSGSMDISPSTDIVLTFKCSACGAEVVIDTASSTQARCHWCRNTLSMNQQIPNGAVPDVVLPFSLTKDQAVEKISAFVKKRTFFAHPKFKREFNPENVMGVYLPYMIVDVNAHAKLIGQGEHETSRYTVKVGDDEETRYDADVYSVAREFDIHINDLTVESSTERLDRGLHNTNNIINSIMPFDVSNSVKYDSNFLSGFTSERRDTNMGDLTPLVTVQSKDITRHSANETLEFYDRGVRWDSEQFDIAGQRWISAYLPVWLYSYFEDKGSGKGLLHYVAVNGRTGETMGSVPLNQLALLGVSAIVQVIGMIIGIVILLAGG